MGKHNINTLTDKEVLRITYQKEVFMSKTSTYLTLNVDDSPFLFLHIEWVFHPYTRKPIPFVPTNSSFSLYPSFPYSFSECLF